MAQSIQQSSTKYIDYLNEDEPIIGQLWACISFLSPEGIKNCSIRGLKVRGIYGTKPEADNRAKELQEIDPDFHVFVGEVGKWLPWDPDPSDVKDQVYQEKELNDLMKGYKDSLAKSKRMHNERKDDMIKQAAKEEQTREAKAKARLQKKLVAKKQQDSEDNKKQETPKDLTQKEMEIKELEKTIKSEDNMVKSERQRITENQTEINKTSQNIESIDSKLAKIQELYEKLNKKK